MKSLKKLMILMLLTANSMAVFSQEKVEASSLTIDFTVNHSLMLVKMNVEGQQLTLIFDTGAERTMIQSKDNVERTRICQLGTKLLRLPTLYVDLAGMGLDKVHADGMLGQDVLQKFKSISINYTNKTITLQ